MPTDGNARAITFTPLGRRQLLARFDGGHITSDAGALLLREVAARSNLFARMADAVPDPRKTPAPNAAIAVGTGLAGTVLKGLVRLTQQHRQAAGHHPLVGLPAALDDEARQRAGLGLAAVE